MILFISDFDLKGSGYMQIAVSLCNELATKHGRKVTALGIAYDSSEHNWPFQILPVSQVEMLREIPTMIYNFKEMGANGQWDPIEAIVVALDVPVQEKLLQIDRGSIPYIGIFPVESGPLCQSWADSLSLMTQRLVISEFGTRMVEDAGVDATYMPIGIDTASWRAPGVEERKAIRQSLGFTNDDYVVLTVADNQERKNLSVAMDMVARSRKRINAKWMLVTRLQCPVGWKLNDLAAYYDMTDHFVAFDRGLPFDRLWILYAAADAFLLTSKAEGLCTLPDSPIWTLDGAKPIQSIESGEQVLAHSGSLRTVTSIKSRWYSGEIVSIEPRYGLPKLRLTPEHPVLAFHRRRHGAAIWGKRRLLEKEPKWIAASELAEGDFIYLPRAESREITHIRISDWVRNLATVDGAVSKLGRNQFGAEFPHPAAVRRPDFLSVNEDLMTIIGLYLAEGCWTQQGPDFSFHSKETKLMDRLQGAFDAVFGKTGRLTVRDRHRASIRFDEVLIGDLLAAMCGKGSHEKNIPAWCLWLPEDLLWPMLRAMFDGDGSLQTNGQSVLRYSTVSVVLAEQLQFVLSRLGILSYLYRGTRGDFEVRIHGDVLADVPFAKDDVPPPSRKKGARYEKLLNGFAVPIKNVTRFSYEGIVYNLEVEHDESYTIGGLAVHNCLPVLESMATETPVLALNTTAIPEHIYADPDWSRLSEGQWGKGHPRGKRGFEIPVEFVTMDPWGNSFRSFANAKEGARALVKLANTKPGKLQAVLSAGRAYAEARTWQKAGDVLAEAIRIGIGLTTPPPAEVAPTGLPASAPRPLPPMYTIPDTGGIEDV